MPQLVFRGVEPQTLKSISKTMIDELVEICECPRDYFTLEVLNSTYIFDGDEVESYPFINVYWFDRGQEVKDKIASVISKHLNASGLETVDIIFNPLKAEDYYENATHF